MINRLLITVFSAFIAGNVMSQGNSVPPVSAEPMPYVLDFVHNNIGEAPFVTKYSDPTYLKLEGFNGAVAYWYVNCAITYDNYKKNLVRKGTAERKWIEAKAAVIDRKLDSCRQAGIDAYPFTDFLVFPNSVWEKYGGEITGKGAVVGTDMSNRGRKPDIKSPRTQELLRAQIDGIFSRFPSLAGITLRFGETYLQEAPYHLGGSPIDANDAINDHILLINILREEICVKRNKKLFYRTWDFGYNFHNNPQFYLAVTDKIEPHPNLLFSIKYQQGDYHRNTPFNPSIGKGRHPQIIEAQSRMEAYGKGAHPYYTAIGVINGWPETKYVIEGNRVTETLNPPSNPRGLRDVLSSGLLKGVMTWSHGGGWRGPYITHEIWTDLNTYVVSHWAQNPVRTEEELFDEFTGKLGLTPVNADRFRQIALLSVEGVRKGQLNSYASNNVWWSRDEFFSVADNRDVIDDIMKRGVADKVLAEKAEASAIWLQIEAVSRQLVCPDTALQEAIRVSCTYGRIKYQLIEQMWLLMLENRSSSPSKSMIANAIVRYDELWDEWKKLKASSRWCATLYTDKAFAFKDGEIGVEKGGIGEFVNSLREK